MSQSTPESAAYKELVEANCFTKGHDWLLQQGAFYDTATCVNCGRKIRGGLLRRSDLPNARSIHLA